MGRFFDLLFDSLFNNIFDFDSFFDNLKNIEKVGEKWYKCL